VVPTPAPSPAASAEDDCGLFFASTSLRDTANPLHLADTYIDITKASVPEHYAPKATLLETDESVITSPEWLDAAMAAAQQLAGQAQEHPLSLMDQARGHDRAGVYRSIAHKLELLQPDLHCVTRTAGAVGPEALQQCLRHD
jgi:hypothetical protein